MNTQTITWTAPQANGVYAELGNANGATPVMIQVEAGKSETFNLDSLQAANFKECMCSAAFPNDSVVTFHN